MDDETMTEQVEDLDDDALEDLDDDALEDEINTILDQLLQEEDPEEIEHLNSRLEIPCKERDAREQKATKKLPLRKAKPGSGVRTAGQKVGKVLKSSAKKVLTKVNPLEKKADTHSTSDTGLESLKATYQTGKKAVHGVKTVVKSVKTTTRTIKTVDRAVQSTARTVRLNAKRTINTVKTAVRAARWAVVHAIAAASHPLFWILVAVVALYILVAVLSYKKVGKLSEDYASAETKQTGQLADSMSNILAVKSYGREAHEKRRYAGFSNATYNAGMKQMRAVIVRDVWFGMVIIGCVAASTIFLVFGNKLGIDIETLILISTYSVTIIGNLWDVNNILKSVNRVFGDAHDMTAILDTEDAVQDHPNVKDIKVTKGAIKFDAIRFQHADAPRPIFDNFTLDVKAGERIGLVGLSGSGKTKDLSPPHVLCNKNRPRGTFGTTGTVLAARFSADDESQPQPPTRLRPSKQRDRAQRLDHPSLAG